MSAFVIWSLLRVNFKQIKDINEIIKYKHVNIPTYTTATLKMVPAVVSIPCKAETGAIICATTEYRIVAASNLMSQLFQPIFSQDSFDFIGQPLPHIYRKSQKPMIKGTIVEAEFKNEIICHSIFLSDGQYI